MTLVELMRRHALDALIVVVACGTALGVAVAGDAAGGPETSAWFAAPAIALVPLPLLARRRFPLGAPALVWLAGAALSFIDGRVVVWTPGASVAGLAASYLLGNLADAAQARLGLALTLGASSIVVFNDPRHEGGELVFVPLFFALAWLAGYALRERAAQAQAAEGRAAQAERERDAATRLAVAEERARIARELHDIVAHAMSVMVLQVGAVRHKLPDALDEDRAALMGVERAGRTALGEMRRLLAGMREDGDGADLAPHPGLEQLDALAAQVTRAGLPVSVHVDGDPFPLPRGIDLSAYRIVQEGLTNALKHAHAAGADVTVRYRPEELQIEVRDDGRGGAAGDGLGHGLVGVRERVKIYGGEMSAGSAGDGGFVLRTRLPVRSGQP